MDKTIDELHSELKECKDKYAALESKYNEEVTRLKETEEQLRFKMMFLEGVANSTIDGFLVVNPYGQKILQNKRTIELWKIPQDVADDPSGLKQVNHVMAMTVNPQLFVTEIDFLREHPDEKTRDELELIDGTVMDRYSSPVIGADGKNYGRIWTFHDITERKNLEKQLIQLNADKDRFISILAHDLRSPFNSLLGFAHLLKFKLHHYSMERIESMVDSIYNTAQKTFQLLEDTLLWANINSQKITYTLVLTNISEVITEVAGILEPSAKAKDIAIECISADTLNAELDVYMFKAILRNLVSNSIKFTNKGGVIKIAASHDQQQTIVKVSDNGVGIEPVMLEKMFRFTTLNSTPGTDKESGTGLGLLLCKEFVDKHGGKIWIDSIVNQGTTVSFSIPDVK
ncbi:MAG TPA: PAS domain-containing sensor histidine kinase [Bacteroidales bacterium]|nr:PAS domain-containing sensor histidine kinase [Bacteroidales bacterium]